MWLLCKKLATTLSLSKNCMKYSPSRSQFLSRTFCFSYQPCRLKKCLIWTTKSQRKFLIIWTSSIKYVPHYFCNASKMTFAKTVMKVFLDNVLSLVIQETLINPVPFMFCSESVFAIKSDLVKKITSEFKIKRFQREELTQKFETLNAGYNICKQYVAQASFSKFSHS